MRDHFNVLWREFALLTILNEAHHSPLEESPFIAL